MRWEISETEVSRKAEAILSEYTYPRHLVVHASETKVDPVGNSGSRNKEDARHSDLGATFCDLSTHLSLQSQLESTTRGE